MGDLGEGAIQSSVIDAAMLLASGPCLIAALGALALYVVGTRLESRSHALVWSVAFSLSSLQWGLLGLSRLSAPRVVVTAIASLLGLGATILYAHGFRLRRGGRRDEQLFIATAVLVTVTMAACLLLDPQLTTRYFLVPACKAIFFIWAMANLFRSRRSASAAEWSVMVLLLLIVSEAMLLPAITLARDLGVTSLEVERFAALRAQVFTTGPATAATTLFTLLLIAADFSAERRRLVQTDPLTGVLNRLGFEQALRAAGRRRRISVAIADIDHFKAINDRFGHAAGDAALAAFANRLAAGVRQSEVVGRIGGEEFALLLDDAPAEALARMEAMREAAAAVTIERHPDLRFTVSFGVAERGAYEAIDMTMGRADQALYRSKRTGRNRTTLAGAFLG
jgi:diguanylate cyclase (GGDEF)-like protein